jgi:hypothetical protein
MRTASNEASDEAHGRIRSFRNVLLLTGAALALALIVVAFVPAGSGFLPLCSSQSRGGCPSIWQIELVGALGGLLAAVAALREHEGYRGPYGLPLTQSLLKIPSGALTGLLGAIWLQSGVLGAISPQSGARLFAYVAVFGFAQEAFTTFVDSQAGRVLGAAKSPNAAPSTR